MTPLSKHIFIQVNTEAIIDLNEKYNGNFPNGSILQQTILYEQGSMAIGSPIKDMLIDVEPGQELYITILPLQLYGYNKVYFTGFSAQSSNIIQNLPQFPTHELSFSITINSDAKPDTEDDFSLAAVIEEYVGEGEGPKIIQINIDPVLRVIQRRP